MKFAEKPTQSAEYLRQAIPLMVKYKISPNPLNYALWYTYVSKRSPKLNAELDKTLEAYGTCPTLICEKMFREHLIKNEINEVDGFQTKVISVVNNLHKSADIATQCSTEFQSVLEASLVDLKNEDNTLSKEEIIENLSLNTQAISDSNQVFQQQISEAQAEIDKLKEELKNNAYDPRRDQATGLFNKQVYHSEIEQLIQLGPETIVSVTIFELDDFQDFNESFGEQMGDKIILFVANLLKNHCLSPSLAIRFLGPRFAMILFGADIAQAIELSQSLHKKIESIRLRPKSADAINHTLSASFGVTQKQATDSSDTLTDRALSALKKAKDLGGNRILSE